MAWTEPKTDWTSSDYFNPEDYNRIKNNLVYLNEMASDLYIGYDFNDMGDDKTYESYYYPDEINLFESNLESINTGTYPREIGDTKTFYENQPFIDYNELNRMETGILKVYNGLVGQYYGRKKLGFTLGRRRAV